MEDKKYPIEMEVITPLSVGTGNEKEWIRGIDFVQKDSKVYVIDIRRAAACGVDIDRLTELFLRYDEKGITQLLGSQLEKVSMYVFDSPARTDNNIKSFLRTQLYGKPLVAGSSIKGAIRSALFKYLRDSETMNEEVFGTMNDGTDFMRFIRIGDIEMPSTFLANSKIFNLRGSGNQWEGGWKHGNTNREGDSRTTGFYNSIGFNTLYECVAPGSKGFGNISLAAKAFELLEHQPGVHISHASKKHSLITACISDLFYVINDVTRAYLRKDKAFFEKYPAQRTDEIIHHIDNLLAQVPSDGSSCLLKMSAGVGFHSITGDWQFEDYDKTGLWTDARNAGKKKYKSRKTVEYKGKLNLMGFVKLRALSAAEAEEYEQALNQEHEAIKVQLAAPILQREEAMRKQAEVDAERARVAAEAAQKRAAYDAVILLARQLFDAKEWNAAIAKAEEAATLFSGPDHQSIIEACRRELAIEEAQRTVDAGKEEFLKLTLAEALQGKTSAGNLVGTATKWLKGEGKAFGEVEYQALQAAAQALPEKERKKLIGKRKDLIKAIGEEQTTKLFIDLNLK